MLDHEEIVVADLILNAKMSLNEVLNSGYFAMHRLWGMLQERLSYRQMQLSNAIDMSQGSDESRTEYWEKLKQAQPRLYRVKAVPQHVIDRLKELGF